MQAAAATATQDPRCAKRGPDRRRATGSISVPANLPATWLRPADFLCRGSQLEFRPPRQKSVRMTFHRPAAGQRALTGAIARPRSATGVQPLRARLPLGTPQAPFVAGPLPRRGRAACVRLGVRAAGVCPGQRHSLRLPRKQTQADRRQTTPLLQKAPPALRPAHAIVLDQLLRLRWPDRTECRPALVTNQPPRLLPIQQPPLYGGAAQPGWPREWAHPAASKLPPLSCATARDESAALRPCTTAPFRWRCRPSHATAPIQTQPCHRECVRRAQRVERAGRCWS